MPVREWKGCRINLNNYPFAGKMLVTDMDGTLLDRRSRISDENQRAIKRFIAGGGLFTVATGRMFKAVEPYLPVLPMNLPAIVYNGAAIYDFSMKKLLWQNCLTDNIADVAEDLLRQFPGIGLEVFHGEDLYLPAQNAVTDRHMIREGFHPVFACLKDIPRPWIKLLIASNPEKLLEVEAFLKARKEEFHAVYSESQFLELLNKNVTKGSALKRLAEMANLPCEAIVAMGDNKNDLEMLLEAGTGVAVKNAHKDVITAADLVCSRHDNDAVAEVIRWIEDGTIKSNVAV